MSPTAHRQYDQRVAPPEHQQRVPHRPSPSMIALTTNWTGWVATDHCGAWRDRRNRARPTKTGRYKNRCDECHLWFMPSGVLIMSKNPGFDWQGHLPLKCFRCLQLQGPWGQEVLQAHARDTAAGGDDTAPTPRYADTYRVTGEPLPWNCAQFVNKFHSERKRMWLIRRHEGNENVVRARGISFANAMKDMERQYPQMLAAKRLRMADAQLALATDIMKGYAIIQRDAADKYARAWQKWEDHYARVAAEPSYVPKMYDPVVLRHDLAQCLCELLPGLSEHFVYQYQTCTTIAHAAYWIETRSRKGGWKMGGFHCPECGQRYKPNKTANDTYTGAQMALILAAPMATDRPDSDDLAQRQRAVDNGEFLTDTAYTMFLIAWPDTGTTMLLDEWKTLSAQMSVQIVEEFRSMSPDEGRERIRALSRAQVPVFFKDFPMGILAQQLEFYNQQKDILVVDHLPLHPDRATGYKGLKFSFDPKRHTVLGVQDVVRTLGLVRCLSTVMANLPPSKM